MGHIFVFFGYFASNSSSFIDFVELYLLHFSKKFFILHSSFFIFICTFAP